MPGLGVTLGGLPGRLVMVAPDPLQLSLGLLGAGLAGDASVTCRRDLGLSRAAQLGLVPRGVLADLPLRSLAAWP